MTVFPSWTLNNIFVKNIPSKNDRALRLLASSVRSAFERQTIDVDMLKLLYQQYNPLEDIDAFFEKAAKLFPALNCGIASVYLVSHMGIGTVVRGMYQKQRHTFVKLDEDTILDITADQFGGPKVYVGPVQDPWSLQ
jgi:hypothetical protein